MSVDTTMPSWTRFFAWAALGCTALMAQGCGKVDAPPEPIRAVRTLVLSETGGMNEREFSAEIRARIESRLGFRVPGKILRRQAELGQSVRPGQVLAQLDPKDLSLNQEAGRAGLAAAQANADQAASDFKRFSELRAQGFISDAELERHGTALKAAQASLRQARAQAGVQGNQADYASLVAEGSGVVTSVDAEPGQVVSAGMPVVTVALDGPRDAVFSVPEDMAPTLRALVGRAGELKVRRWGSPDWLAATVREVAAAADPVTRTFLVKADVGRGAYELGQTATVMLSTPVRNAAGLRVPLQALVESDGRSAVWVLDGSSMTVRPQPVLIGNVLGNVVVVTQGLKPGMEIVTAGVHVVQPGQKVRRFQPALTAPAASAAASSASQPALKS